jgi:hypothetical protein
LGLEFVAVAADALEVVEGVVVAGLDVVDFDGECLAVAGSAVFAEGVAVEDEVAEA